MNDRFVGRAEGVLILEKSSFTGTNGQVYRIHIEARGLSKWFVADSQEEYNTWPEKGTTCNVECDLEVQKDGALRLVRPKFTPVRADNPPQRKAG